jgi:hypothetical protein
MPEKKTIQHKITAKKDTSSSVIEHKQEHNKSKLK